MAQCGSGGSRERIAVGGAEPGVGSPAEDTITPDRVDSEQEELCRRLIDVRDLPKEERPPISLFYLHGYDFGRARIRRCRYSLDARGVLLLFTSFSSIAVVSEPDS